MLPKSCNETCKHGNYRGRDATGRTFQQQELCWPWAKDSRPKGPAQVWRHCPRQIHRSEGWMNEISFKVSPTRRPNTPNKGIRVGTLVVTNKYKILSYKQITSFCTSFHFNQNIRQVLQRQILYNETIWVLYQNEIRQCLTSFFIVPDLT